MSGQGSGHRGGQQHHLSQQPHHAPGSSTQAGPSNQAGAPTHPTGFAASDPRLNDLVGINHAFFHVANGFKNQALARAHPRWPDILVVNLFVLRNLLGLDLIDFPGLIEFPDLLHSHDEFRNIQLRQMNTAQHYHFHTKQDAMILALAVSRDTTVLGPCNHCQDHAHGPSNPFFFECRSQTSIFGGACGNCELHKMRKECSYYNGIAPKVVFHSKASEPFTPLEDNFIALLRTCTQDQAGDIKQKYFPNRPVISIGGRIPQLFLEKKIPAFKTAL